MNNAPCKECPDRFVRKEDDKTVTCHMVCEKYISFRNNREKEYESRVEAANYNGFKHDVIVRMQKAKHRR